MLRFPAPVRVGSCCLWGPRGPKGRNCISGVWTGLKPKNRAPDGSCTQRTVSVGSFCIALWVCHRAGEEGGGRGWDGWMAPPTQWTWVWANWEMVKDRKACHAAVLGVTKSQTQLSDWTTTTQQPWTQREGESPWCGPRGSALGRKADAGFEQKSRWWVKKSQKKGELRFQSSICSLGALLGILQGWLLQSPYLWAHWKQLKASWQLHFHIHAVRISGGGTLNKSVL